MFFPISDDNSEAYRFKVQSFVNLGVIVLCTLVFLHEASLGDSPKQLQAFVDAWSFSPKDYLDKKYLHLSYPERFLALLAVLSHLHNGALIRMIGGAFLHGGFLHLFGNMIGLWMLGDNVEYAMGHVRYLLFFLLTALLSFMGQMVFVTPADFQGAIGASGAIFAIAGAYMAYFPKARINFFYFFVIFFGVTSYPARVVIALFFLSQLLTSLGGMGTDYGMVAVWAHVTGFVAGFLLSFVFRRSKGIEKDYQPKTRAAYRRRLGPWERK